MIMILLTISDFRTLVILEPFDRLIHTVWLVGYSCITVESTSCRFIITWREGRVENYT